MRRLATLFPLLLQIGFGATACNNGLSPYSFIRELSVLGVRAEPPEVGFGETTRLEALYADPNGRGRQVQLTWELCNLAPLPGDPVNRRCVTEETGSFLIPIGSGPVVDFTVPALPTIECRLPFPGIELKQPLKCPGTLGLPDDSASFNLPVRLTARAGDRSFFTIYLLRFSFASQIRAIDPRLGALVPVNRNPDFDELTGVVEAADKSVTLLAPLADGAVVPAGGALTLHPTFAPDAAEQFLNYDAQAGMVRPFTEALRVSWFVTAGAISPEHTGAERPDTVLKIDAKSASRSFDLWAVVRDGRGGAGFLHRTLGVK